MVETREEPKPWSLVDHL